LYFKRYRYPGDAAASRRMSILSGNDLIFRRQSLVFLNWIKSETRVPWESLALRKALMARNQVAIDGTHMWPGNFRCTYIAVLPGILRIVVG